MTIVNEDPFDKIDGIKLIQLANELYNENTSIPYTHKSMTSSTNQDCRYYFMKDFNEKEAKKLSNRYFIKSYDVESIRKDFPILHRRIKGKPLVWFDNSATTQKPYCVMQSLNKYYSEINSNVHRGAHTLAKLSTKAYESAREIVQKFIKASSPDEIIFVRGATEAINLVSQTYGDKYIEDGDEILITTMEHHSNIVPWQTLKQTKGAVIKPIPIDDNGEIILDEYEKLFTPRTKLVAINHVSNVLGTINPVRIMTEIAHKHGATVLVDGAQAVPHIGINVNEIDADFYVFSGHKIYGPTGIGVLYGKRALLEDMPPWQKGGGMIKSVDFDKTVYNSLPSKFEAGTGNIAGAVGLSAAIDYIKKIGMDNIEDYEKELTKYAKSALLEIPGIQLLATPCNTTLINENKTSVLSFNVDGISPEKVASYLNEHGIAVRAGHHCAQPALRRYGLDSIVRASLGMYNTKEEIDSFINALRRIDK